jgi:LuxR family transcriptional regulator, maltose regulon positive regulatory protein
VLLAAPAGCGKTTTLVQWTEADDRPVAWLPVDRADSDAVVFTTYLASAPDGIVRAPQEVFELPGQAGARVQERIVPLLSTAVAGAPPFPVGPRRLPPGAQPPMLEHGRVLARTASARRADRAGRSPRPPLRLARLRAEGRLTELRMDRLALNAEEACQLLELHGAVMDDRSLAAVMEVTEGWPTGVYLAAVLAESHPPDEWLPRIVIISPPSPDKRAVTEAIGVCPAVAIAPDAIIVHVLVAPATMRILGWVNWWQPARPPLRDCRSAHT